MQAELQAHLKNHGLNLALSPLLSVGVDAPQALRYIDDQVIECMQREHGLALVTAKILKAKLPTLLQWAARCPSYAGDILAGSSVSMQNTHQSSASCFAGTYGDSRALVEGPREHGRSQEGNYGNAGLRNDAERVYAERGGDLGQADARQEAEGLGQADAREEAEGLGQADAREEGEGLGQADGREEGEGLSQADGQEEGEGLSQADEFERMLPQDVRKGCISAGYASALLTQGQTEKKSAMHSGGKRVRFECYKCLRLYLWSSPQTFMANKANHLKYCKGLHTEGGASANAPRKSQSTKKNRTKAKGTSAMKKSSLVTKANASLPGKTKTGRSVCSDHDLTSCAHSLLKMSREATFQAQSEQSIEMEIEASDKPFRFDHYVTQEENENCASIAEKFGIDAAGVFGLNRTRYRGLKTERTKLKMGTNIILSVTRPY